MQDSIGRDVQIVDCRESMGIGEGGGLAQRGTISESESFEVVAIAMSPSKRHITKPICEITYGSGNRGYAPACSCSSPVPGSLLTRLTVAPLADRWLA